MELVSSQGFNFRYLWVVVFNPEMKNQLNKFSTAL